MYPYRIRLRGPWEARHGDNVKRIHLPATWSDLDVGDYVGPVALERRFGRPSNIDATERIWLVGEGFVDRSELSLQGQSLGVVAGDAFAFEVTSLIGPRNRLEVKLAAYPGREVLWGDIALEIRATAYLSDVRRDAGAIEGRVVGECEGPLEIYVLDSGRTVGYKRLAGIGEFSVPIESNADMLRVELMHVSEVWFVVENV